MHVNSPTYPLLCSRPTKELAGVAHTMGTEIERPMTLAALGLKGLIVIVLLTESVQAAGDVAVFDIGDDLDPFIYAVVS